MAVPNTGYDKAAEWASLGVEALKGGRLAPARDYLSRAVAIDKNYPYYRFELALAEQALGNAAAAARELCAAIRLKPDFDDASRRLAALLARGRPKDPKVLDPFALRTAMGVRDANRQALAEAAIDLIARGPLQHALAQITAEGPAQAVARLIAKRTAEPLGDALLLAALENGVNSSIPMERLLTVLRRGILLDVAPERFSDKVLQAFALALVRQGWANEHVWAESPDESERVAALETRLGSLDIDSFEAGRSILLVALYRSPAAIRRALPSGTDLARLRPQALRDALLAAFAADEEEAELAAFISSGAHGGLPAPDTVARQNEDAPHPRWSSLALPRPGSLMAALPQVFSDARVAFTAGSFDVLIAGCGTGQHAVQSAIGYGPNANVLAIDLSARSLAYATRMAELYEATNLRFEQADLMAPDPAGRWFHVIECVGALRHLADPFAGWRALLGRLRPDGIMLVGLYSEVSRRPLNRLRAEPDYPGAGCDDQAARAYRARLMARDATEQVAGISQSGQGFTLSEFRDHVLPELERPVTLAEIDGFLSGNGLAARQVIVSASHMTEFRKSYPDPAARLDLNIWSEFERKHPNVFDGMIRLWCERRE